MPLTPLSNGPRQPNWRRYQADRQKKTSVRGLWRRFPVLLAVFILLAVTGLAWLGKGGWPSPLGALTVPANEPISKKELRDLLEEAKLGNLTDKTFELPVNGQLLQVETTLDVDLQSFLLGKLDRRNSRQIGIVVMEGDTGRVLALVGFDKDDPANNPCLCSDFPAASIFKIVTAASAVDHHGFSAGTSLHFNGNKHTLYKRQLTDVIDRYTTTVSLEEAFADSVNPVFGKLGQISLGKPLLEKSAQAFGFNEALDFDLPLPPSRFQLTDQPYHWAEIASGFNRDTTLSPVHGAMIASAVLNGGRMVAPVMIDRIVDARGQVVYRAESAWQQQAMSAKAAMALADMMEATIISGTARKAFRNHRNDKGLSGLQLGGKTGSIGSGDPNLRYDWFVGFARQRQGPGEVVIGVVVAHDKFIGTRAAEYARMAIARHFGNLPQRNGEP
jgi:penicillin-binding protein A